MTAMMRGMMRRSRVGFDDNDDGCLVAWCFDISTLGCLVFPAVAAAAVAWPPLSQPP